MGKRIAREKLLKHFFMIFVFVLVGWIGVRLVVIADGCRAGDHNLELEDLSTQDKLADGANVSSLVSIEKSVTPEGEIMYGDELVYTLVISSSTDGPFRLYDPLKGVTFKRFVERPSGIAYAQAISGTLRFSTITGTLVSSLTSPVTVSFVAQMDAPGTLGGAVAVTNRACVYPFEGTLGGCIWSNEVSNVAYRPNTLYLPLVLRSFRSSGYYVDRINGNDANPGTSPAKAWRTLAPVHATDLAPGDIVHLKRGCTWSGGLVIDESGEPDNPITFTAYGEGERPTITNPGNKTRGITIYANWIVVEGLYIQDVHVDGVYVPADYGHNIIRDCEITDAGTGITFNGQHNLATGNHIHDLRMIVNTPGGDDDYGATAIKFRGPYNEAAYNHLERCSAPSYDYDTDGGGFEFFGTADGSHIHHNLVEDTDGFLEIGTGSARNVTIAYNTSVDNGRFSWIHLSGTFACDVKNLRVEHNTIIETGDNPHWVIFGFRGGLNSDTFILRNNIVYVNEHGVVSNEGGFTHDHNLYQLEGGTVLGFDLGPGEQIANPRFVDLGRRDVRLRSNSPAVDAGVDLGYTEDFEGRLVPVNDVPDLGAFEYPGVPERPPTPTPAPSPTPMPTPNPDEIIIDDVDPGFSTSFSQDDWQEYTYVGGQHYDDAHYYNRERGTGEDTATWTFNVPQPGRYEVYAWWWEGGWRPTDVPYTINHLDGSTTLRVNQQTDGAQWNLLGIFEFEDQGSIMVSDDVSSGRDVVADAVRLVYLEPLAAVGNLSASSVALTVTPVPLLRSFVLMPTPVYGPAYDPISMNSSAGGTPAEPAQVSELTPRPGWIRILDALLTNLRQ